MPDVRVLRCTFWIVTLLAVLRCAYLVERSPTLAQPASISVLPQLEFLAADLEAHADAMQRQFPEGRMLTLALYGLAWSNLARAEGDPDLRRRGRSELQRALEGIEDPATMTPFTEVDGLSRGMFYSAWWGALLAEYLELLGTLEREDRPRDVAFRGLCEDLARAIQVHGPFVASYPGQAWPVDTVVGVAVLRRCADRFDPSYDRVIEDWILLASEALDPATGLLPHGVGPARGSSSALMAVFLPQIDPGWGRQHYERFLAHFATRWLGILPAIREYRHGTDGPPDVDSGPLVDGVSAAATVVGIAGARALGDASTADALRASIEAVGVPWQWHGQRRYAGGQLPVGDAFLAWASSVRRAAGVASFSPSPAADVSGWVAWWRCFVIALLGVCLWRIEVASAKPRRSGLPQPETLLRPSPEAALGTPVSATPGPARGSTRPYGAVPLPTPPDGGPPQKP